eukprot:SAG31_NODE_10926_length_1082_cov_1.747711_1_plen_129_part_10
MSDGTVVCVRTTDRSDLPLQDWNLWPTITAAPPFNLSRATELVIPAQSHDVPARNSDAFKAGPKETPLLDDSPLMEGWQIALTAGRGRLIIFPEASGPLPPPSPPSPPPAPIPPPPPPAPPPPPPPPPP